MVILSRRDDEGLTNEHAVKESRAPLLECETVFVRSLASLGMKRIFVSLAKFAMRRKESA
jgi:hypothetical protein